MHNDYSQPDDEDSIAQRQYQPGSQSSPQQFHLPPTLLTNFPSITAPSHATDLLSPFTTGSTSELFKAIIKKPTPISIEINGELHSNAADVAIQFAAEMRVYSNLGQKKNQHFAAFLGAIEGLGLVLQWIEGQTLLDAIRGVFGPKPNERRKKKWFNQLVDGLHHLHGFGLNHGDLSLLNIHIEDGDRVKIIDFGRSISVEGYPCESLYIKPPPTPREPTPPPAPVFRPGGAWVDSPTKGKEKPAPRPKLFDRSSTPRSGVSGGSSSGVVNLSSPASFQRPITHASRLLHDVNQPPSPHSYGGGAGTHMPVYAPRGRQPPGTPDLHPHVAAGLRSRQGSRSPIRPHYHLASAPMSPRYSRHPSVERQGGNRHMDVDSYGGSDDWTSVNPENYGFGPETEFYSLHHHPEYAGGSHPSGYRDRYGSTTSVHHSGPGSGAYSPHSTHTGSHTGTVRPPHLRKKEREKMHPGSPPFCAPEVMRDECMDPILADAYSLGIILVCLDLGELVRVDESVQIREDGSFPDLSKTKIFTEIIKKFTAKASLRKRILPEYKVHVEDSDDESD